MLTGQTIPDFELLDQDGESRKQSKLVADGPVVLFFYPAAMTTGCTKEACHFRDLAKEFAEVGAQRVGISLDAVVKQKQFSDKHKLDYPWLSDAEGKVAQIFSVKRAFGMLKVKRHTFEIGRDRKLIAEISSEFSMEKHADEALKILKAQPA